MNLLTLPVLRGAGDARPALPEDVHPGAVVHHRLLVAQGVAEPQLRQPDVVAVLGGEAVGQAGLLQVQEHQPGTRSKGKYSADYYVE